MTTTIRYPAGLANKLAQNLDIRSAIDATIVDFSSWFNESKLPFFPDFTDHGPRHINEVIDTAERLIHDSAWNAFSSEDAAVLILSILLHDSALHLSEAGFRELIAGRAAQRMISGLDKASWPELWEEFFFYAQRWDDRKITEVFGETTSHEGLHRLIRDPFSSYDNLRETDRKLIGEFIRQNHARLAHEFSVFGVPGPGDDPIRPSSRFDIDKLDIAGFIARSHGLPLRHCIRYIASRYHKREYQNIHAVFLMTLLRTSDYLQIQSTRASPIVFRYKRIASPLSQIEHRVHKAVKNWTWTNDDPEAIEIQAQPDDVAAFLRIQEWLAGIQQELDASWAVLGEVYGSDKTLSDLGLSIRRIRSNLDDMQLFTQQAPYFPSRVAFDVARAELLRLLIRPLYGNNPEIGIRELLQNAVDAVRELRHWRSLHSKRDIDLIKQEADVEIWLNEESDDRPGFLVISDRGIGMTEEVARDYFLRIGASYRRSHEWQREFEASDRSIFPRSRVLRSGKFGIGVLAAFLLGKEIEISTRHPSATRGFTFKTRLDEEPIEFHYDEGLSVGTTIKVNLDDVFGGSDDSWDWYCFDDPHVLRRKGPQRLILPQRSSVPSDPSQLPLGWYRIETQEFDAVYVGAAEAVGGRQPLVCNGIKIGNRLSSWNSWFDFRAGEFRLATPPIIVLDPDGRLPLNLTRTDLAEKPPFIDEVKRVIYQSILAGMLLHTPSHPPLGKGLSYLESRFDRPMAEMISFSPWLYTPEGVAITDPWSILQTGTDRVLVTFIEDVELAHHSPCTLAGSFIYGEDNLLEVLLSGGILEPLKLKGVRLLMTAQHADRVCRLSQEGLFLETYGLEQEWTNGIWSLLTYGECLSTCIDLERLPTQGRRSSTWPLAAEWFPQSKQEAAATRVDVDREWLFDEWELQDPRLEKPRGLALHWKSVIRDPVIPFNLDERRTKLAHAYETLKPYFAEHRSRR